MAHEIKWHTYDSIVLVKVSGDLEIEEFPIFDKLILEHIEASTLPLIHIWVDLTAVTKFPNNIVQVHKALSHLNHPKTGWSVLITGNRVIRFVGYMITQISKARFRAFDNENEALQFLHSVDKSLKLEA